mmetsp:Transcript_158062/g.507031  ORF Transcript_158062/g.507031 Transcript_158062/m.507031 type:complete len:277 (-) Transcript_158062:308-1138(-)
MWILLHIAPRKAHLSRELRGEVHDGAKLVQGEERVTPRGHRAVHAAGRSNDVGGTDVVETSKEGRIELRDRCREQDEGQTSTGHLLGLPRVELEIFACEVHLIELIVELPLEILVDRALTGRGQKVEVHNHTPHGERATILCQVPSPRFCELVPEKVSHPAEANHGVWHNELDNCIDVTVVALRQDIQQRALVIALWAGIKKNQQTNGLLIQLHDSVHSVGGSCTHNSHHRQAPSQLYVVRAGPRCRPRRERHRSRTELLEFSLQSHILLPERNHV